MTRRLPAVLPLAVVGLLAVLLLVWAHPLGRDSSVLNEDWNGLSRARAELNATALLSYDVLPAMPLPATVILFPHLPVGDQAALVLDHFTMDGGTLVLLDDFGFGNDLLERLGLRLRLAEGVLFDPLYCYRNGSMPRVEFVDNSVGGAHGTMVLNRATWLEGAGPADVWAWSSYFSYGDRDGNSLHGAGEPKGPLPVAASVSRGAGRVVVVADSSLLLNSMAMLGDNVGAVGQWARGSVFIDQVHLPEAEMDRSRLMLDVMQASLGQGGGAVLLVMAAASCAVGYAWYNRGRRDDE